MSSVPADDEPPRVVETKPSVASAATRLSRSAPAGIHRRTGFGGGRVLKAVWNDAARVDDSLPENPVSRGVRLNRERPRDWALSVPHVKWLVAKYALANEDCSRAIRRALYPRREATGKRADQP